MYFFYFLKTGYGKGAYINFGRPWESKSKYSPSDSGKTSIFSSFASYDDKPLYKYGREGPNYSYSTQYHNHYVPNTKTVDYYRGRYDDYKRPSMPSYYSPPKESYFNKIEPSKPYYEEEKKEESYETTPSSTYEEKKEEESYETTTEYYTTEEYTTEYVTESYASTPTVYNVNEPSEGEDRQPAIVIKVYPIYATTTEKYSEPEPVVEEYTTEYVEPVVETTPYYEEEKKEESYETTPSSYEVPTTEYYKEESKSYSLEAALTGSSYGSAGAVYGTPLVLQQQAGYNSNTNGYASGPVFILVPAMFQQAHAMIPVYAPSYPYSGDVGTSKVSSGY